MQLLLGMKRKIKEREVMEGNLAETIVAMTKKMKVQNKVMKESMAEMNEDTAEKLKVQN